MKLFTFISISILIMSHSADDLHAASFFPFSGRLVQEDEGVRASANAELFPISLREKGDINEEILDLSALARPQVKESLFIYLTGAREYAQRGIDRSRLYMDTIKEVHSKYADIPEPVLYLPMLESGFLPTAESRMKAVGVWQIIAPTAKMLGLKIDPLCDERRNVEKSTDAAFRHLLNLKQQFSSWDLALAAYNCGSGRIVRGMRKLRTDDFWTLSRKKALRLETVNYIPYYAALTLIASRPDLFYIEYSPESSEPFDIEEFVLESPVLVKTLALLSGVPADDIYRMNPELTGALTPAGVKQYRIKIPAGASERLTANSGALYEHKIRSVSRYQVKKGDSLSKIAKAYGTDPSLIVLVNNMQKPYALKKGRTLFIPRS